MESQNSHLHPKHKIAILIESDFYENEIFYYKYRFAEEDFELHFLSRLWGQEHLTFYGHEYKAPMDCRESFENMSDEELNSYSAIIIPSGMVADRLRYTEDINKLPPAVEFMKRAFAQKNIIKGIICHGLWLLAPATELVKGRKLVCHNNLLGDAKAYGAVYVNNDVVIDNDLITARAGDYAHLLAKEIIKQLNK
ncbi:MAG: DJ-1/PfpI family protein [Prolixibacteraceae bacterium]|nr:DJ-1/PfpI family protein [Prolixibacteraceae bacterium]MBN2650158.1 DJ-1/PfpI family protein [Prolixibacteraceae bacterium]